MNWNQLVKAGMGVAAMAACFAAQAASNGIIVTLAPEKNSLNKSDDVVLRVTITNTSAIPQYVLKWHTPFAGVEEALFEITRDGVEVPYLGAHHKRAAPTARDYYLLKPGASHTAKVELSALYDMSVTGDYAIRYRAASVHLFRERPNGRTNDIDMAQRGGAAAAEDDADIGEMESTPVSLWINGRLERGTRLEDPLQAALKQQAQNPGTQSLAFSNCTASQTSSITSAIGAAKTMANGSNTYLANNLQGARYTKWFGAYTSARYSTVKSHFVNIKGALDSKPVVVDCGCKTSSYAYVYANQPYKIYVCNAFWSAPMTGTDSKGGTLIHELSHFSVVAGTDDWAYGQSAAASLARKSPSRAVDNADSHEYFAENTPALQ